MSRRAAGVLLLGLAACTAKAPSAVASASPKAMATVASSSRVSPIAAVTAKAAASPPASPRVATLGPLLLAAPDAPPQIVSIAQAPPVLRGGSNATFTVTTSSNTASVELRAQTFGMSMARPKIGTFTLTYFVPPLPPLFPHTFTVAFVARNAAGVAVTRTTSVTIH